MKQQASPWKWDMAINVFVDGLASAFVIGRALSVWVWMELAAPDLSA